jgi:succinate dehydrogenase / fumarate reductase cytochrome b subunit
MSSHADVQPGDAAGEPRSTFLRSKLASILAVVPLGVWTVAHVWNNLAVYDGGPAWERSVTTYPHPVAQLVTAVLVFAPLLLHTFWGLGRLLVTRPNNVKYGYYTNLKYLLQRVSAVGVLLFLGAHVWLALIQPRFVEGRPEPFVEIAHEMRHHGPTLAVYLLGTLGVAYHLANGLATVAFSFGLVTTPKAQKRFEGVVLLFFLGLLAMSWGAIYGLYRAGA